MKEAITNFQVDIVGDYRFDKRIYNRVNRFGPSLPIDHNGVLRAGEYKLPTGGAYAAASKCAARTDGIAVAT